MIFLGKDYFTKVMPAYTMLKSLSDSGHFKHMLLILTDDNDEIVEALERFKEGRG